MTQSVIPELQERHAPHTHTHTGQVKKWATQPVPMLRPEKGYFVSGHKHITHGLQETDRDKLRLPSLRASPRKTSVHGTNAKKTSRGVVMLCGTHLQLPLAEGERGSLVLYGTKRNQNHTSVTHKVDDRSKEASVPHGKTRDKKHEE